MFMCPVARHAPEQIIDGVLKIQELVKHETMRRRYSPEYQHLLDKYQIGG